MKENETFFITKNHYISHRGFYGKIYQIDHKWYGEVLNVDDDLMFVDDTFESAKRTFKLGINDYIEKYSEAPVVYDTISAKELIAQLALCISDASIPVYMENGVLITGVYRQDGCLRIDTDNKRIQYIQKSLKD